jgi:hypothetical protein
MPSGVERGVISGSQMRGAAAATGAIPPGTPPSAAIGTSPSSEPYCQGTIHGYHSLSELFGGGRQLFRAWNTAMEFKTKDKAQIGQRGLAGCLLMILLVTLAFAGDDWIAPQTLSATVAQEGRLARLPLPPDLRPASAPEHFIPQTLFEIINGEADLFLKAGFLDLETRTFFLDGDAKRWIDLFVYRMDSHRSAFAVFSVKRGPEAAPAGRGTFSYRQATGLFFVQGLFYVEIHAADESAPLITAVNDLAEAVIRTYPATETAIPELTLFPETDLVPHSTVLQSAGAFGFDGFDDLFTARYRVKGRDATAFFRICPSPEAAIRLAADYQSFLLTFDGEQQASLDGLPNSWLMRVMDSHTLVFTAGRALGGIQDVADPELAALLARRLYERLASADI